MIIGFSRPKTYNPLSWAIMKFLGTTYSHTYIVFTVNSTGQQVVYQANRHGVNCIEYENFKKINVIIEEIPVSLNNRTSALKFCIDHLGKSYSILTLFAILFNVKFGDGTKYFICSELVARALGIERKNIDNITPLELKTIIEKGL